MGVLLPKPKRYNVATFTSTSGHSYPLVARYGRTGKKPSSDLDIKLAESDTAHQHIRDQVETWQEAEQQERIDNVTLDFLLLALTLALVLALAHALGIVVPVAYGR